MNHASSVGALALTSDGSEIVSADVTGQVRRWNRLSGEALFPPLTAHDRSIWAVLLSPDDKEIITSGSDGTVRRWERGSARPIGEPFTVHTDWIRALALASDGREFLTAAQDGVVRRWDLASGIPLGEPLTGHNGAVRAIAVTPDGSEIITVGQDGTIRRWDRNSGSPLAAPVVGHPGGISALALNSDGSEILTAGRDAVIRRWDRATGRPIGDPFAGHTAAIRGLSLTSGDSEIVTGGSDGTIRSWERATGRPIGAPVKTGQGSVWALALTPDGTEIITAGWDGSIRRWDRLSGAPALSSGDDTRPITAIVLTAGPNPSVLGEAVTVAATVTGPDAAAPTGDVTFTDAEVGAGTRMLGRAPLTAGSASLSVPDLPVGTHFITGSYGGDSSFRPSSGVVARRVEEVGSRTDAMSLAQHFLSQSATRAGEGRRAEAVAAARAAVDVLHGIEAPAGHEVQYFLLLAEALHSLVGRLVTAGRVGEVEGFAEEAVGVYRRAAGVSSGEMVLDRAPYLLSLSSLMAGLGPGGVAVSAARAAVDVLHGIEAPAGHEVQYFLLLAEALHSLVGRLVTAGRVGEVEGFAEEAVGVYRRAAGVSSGEMVLDRAPYLLSLSSLMAGLGPGGVAVSAARAAVDVLHGIEAPAGHEVQYFLLLAEALHSLVGRLVTAGRVGEVEGFAEEAVGVYRRAAGVSSGEMVLDRAPYLLSLSSLMAGLGPGGVAVSAARAAVDVLHGIEAPAGHEVQYFLLLAEALHSLVGRLVTAGRVGEVEGFAEEAVGVYRRAAGVSSGEMVLDRAPYLLSLSSLMAGLGPGGVAVSAARAAVDVLHGIEAPAGHEAQYFSLLAQTLRTFGNRLIEAGRPEEATQPTQDAMQAEQLAASFG